MQRGLVARNFIPPRCGKYHMSSAVCAAMICMPVRAPPRLLCGGLCTRRQHCAADLRNCVRREECAEGCCNQELREAAPPLCLRSVVSMEHITLFPTEHNRYLRIGSIKTPASVCGAPTLAVMCAAVIYLLSMLCFFPLVRALAPRAAAVMAAQFVPPPPRSRFQIAQRSHLLLE